MSNKEKVPQDINDSFEDKSKTSIISDVNLEVQFDHKSNILSVMDKRCNKLWEQLPLEEGFSVDEVFQSGNVLTLMLNGYASMKVTIELTDKSDLNKN